MKGSLITCIKEIHLYNLKLERLEGTPFSEGGEEQGGKIVVKRLN